MVIWLDSDMAIKKEMANKKKKKSAAIKRKVATNIRSKNSSKKISLKKTKEREKNEYRNSKKWRVIFVRHISS